jgi:hypothetical protein
VIVMAAKQPTVRVNQPAKQKLDRIQAQTKLSQPALLDRAIDLLERDMLTKQLAEDLDDLARDPEMLRRYRELSEVFDGTAGDGLRRE